MKRVTRRLSLSLFDEGGSFEKGEAEVNERFALLIQGSFVSCHGPVALRLTIFHLREKGREPAQSSPTSAFFKSTRLDDSSERIRPARLSVTMLTDL